MCNNPQFRIQNQYGFHPVIKIGMSYWLVDEALLISQQDIGDDTL